MNIFCVERIYVVSVGPAWAKSRRVKRARARPGLLISSLNLGRMGGVPVSQAYRASMRSPSRSGFHD